MEYTLLKKKKELRTLVHSTSTNPYYRDERLALFLRNPGGPGSVVGIATGYGLDGPGIESRWGRDFLYLSRPALGPTQPPGQFVPGLSWG